MKTAVFYDPCSSTAQIQIHNPANKEATVDFDEGFHSDCHPPSYQHTPAFAADSNSSSKSSKASSRDRTPIYFPLWLRLSRVVFGKIRRLPKSMSTTLVLFTVHMYLTVPVIVVCGVTGDLRALLRPFRLMKEQGFLFEELGDFEMIGMMNCNHDSVEFYAEPDNGVEKVFEDKRRTLSVAYMEDGRKVIDGQISATERLELTPEVSWNKLILKKAAGGISTSSKIVKTTSKPAKSSEKEDKKSSKSAKTKRSDKPSKTADKN